MRRLIYLLVFCIFATLRELSFIIVLLFTINTSCFSQSNFVQVKKTKFYIQNKEYTFVGTNYWYGGFLAFDTKNRGKQRLKSELDFLKKQGITNLRVLFSSEGDSSYPYRISPSIQEKPGQFNEEILRSFDYFIVEAAKRNMKIVFVLNNNWEWSGGFGQYLECAGFKNPILPKTNNWDWDKYCDYISQFYTCDSCQKLFKNFITKIVNRKNSISNQYYKNDPTIMTWELANEPRPMRASQKMAYKNWIKTTSEFIKKIDKNHLVTTGVEGIISTSMDTSLFVEIHEYKTIDYATMHIWPKTWRWYNGESSHSTTDSTLEKSGEYIRLHAKLCSEINRPLVIEEFGLHRDDNKFKQAVTTCHRDKYFDFIFKTGNKNNIAGYNFWGAVALTMGHAPLANVPLSDFWKYGQPYAADPPQEEQGLYGVYLNDSSTWKSIKKYSK
jgi:mannan endo-1,4-beta-mannosidase